MSGNVREDGIRGANALSSFWLIRAVRPSWHELLTCPSVRSNTGALADVGRAGRPHFQQRAVCWQLARAWAIKGSHIHGFCSLAGKPTNGLQACPNVVPKSSPHGTCATEERKHVGSAERRCRSPARGKPPFRCGPPDPRRMVTGDRWSVSPVHARWRCLRSGR